MITFFLYLLKSGICLLLFYVCFKALFSNETFFRLNRWLLLTGVLCCFLLPAIPLKTSEIIIIQRPVLHLEKFVTKGYIPIEEINSDTKISDVSSPTTIPWDKILLLFYLSGCVACTTGTLISFHRMYQLIRSGKRITQDDHTIILSPAPIVPFSWEHYIILSEEDYRNNPNEILIHEKMHLHYRHSLDLIFMEVALIIHWFNPAIWLLKRELRDIHEYQADKGVLNQGIDATKYQLLLVKKAVGSSLYTLANSFNHSKIKKRITMMLKKKSNSWAQLKLLLLVPVGFTAVCMFARPETTEMNRSEKGLSISAYKDTISPKKMKEEGKSNDVNKSSVSTLSPSMQSEVIYYSPNPPKEAQILFAQIQFKYKDGTTSGFLVRAQDQNSMEALKLAVNKISPNNVSIVKIEIWKNVDVKKFCDNLDKAFDGKLKGDISYQLSVSKNDTHFAYIMPEN